MGLHISETDDVAAEYCVTYLSFTDFETALTRASDKVQMGRTGVLGPEGPGSIPETLGLGGSAFDKTQRFIRRPSRTVKVDINYGKHLQLKPKSQDFDADNKYTMRKYVSQYWLEHTMRLSKSSATYQKFVKLATEKMLPFDFRPWGINRHYGPYGCSACPFSAVNDPRSKDLPLTSLFHWAAQSGHLPLVNMIEGSYVSHASHLQQLLEIACQYGQLPILRYFLYDIPRILLPKLHVPQLLEIACQSGALDCLRELFDWREACLLRMEDEELDKMLDIAAANGHTKVGELLIERGANHFLIHDKTSKSSRYDITNIRSYDMTKFLCRLDWKKPILAHKLLFGPPTLHKAVQDGQTAVVEALLYQLPNLDMRDNSQQTALMKAAREGHEKVVQLLVEAGADPIAAIRYSVLPAEVLTPSPEYSAQLALSERLAVHFAAENGHCEVLQILRCSFYQKIHAVTALHLAVEYSHHNVVKFLIGEVICDDKFHDGSENAIHFATSSGLVKALQAILDYLSPRERKLCINVKSSRGMTALHLAVTQGNIEAVQILINFGAEVHETDNRDQPILSDAVRSGNAELLAFLLDSGASYLDLRVFCFVESVSPNSPLRNAAERGDMDILKLLLENCPTNLPEFFLEKHLEKKNRSTAAASTRWKSAKRLSLPKIEE